MLQLVMYILKGTALTCMMLPVGWFGWCHPEALHHPTAPGELKTENLSKCLFS